MCLLTGYVGDHDDVEEVVVAEGHVDDVRHVHRVHARPSNVPNRLVDAQQLPLV